MDRKPNDPQRFKRLTYKFWNEWCKPILTVVIVLTTFRSAVADWNDVPTGSMKPTILEGDRIFVNKLAYDLRVPFTDWRIAQWHQPERGDVVILHSPADGTRLVKRVVALPGDTIEMRNNLLLVDGLPLAYGPLDQCMIDEIDAAERGDYLFASEALADTNHAIMITPSVPSPRSFKALVVPPGKYFVMGDNRDQSADSRIFGFVDELRITGEVVGVALSVDPSRYYRPRWHRFFKDID